jgi:hypothetical protein
MGGKRVVIHGGVVYWLDWWSWFCYLGCKSWLNWSLGLDWLGELAEDIVLHIVSMAKICRCVNLTIK